MDVIATAGHVDHGKSSLVRALTGMEPDRLAEERRRGLTIDLGFAWTTLPDGAGVAFVDVPGHQRFVTTMLAGVGSVPAVMLVVAADEGWMPQTDEHVRALDALDVHHGLVVVTKTDLAEPGPVLDEVRRRIDDTSMRGVDAVAVSTATGAGLGDVTNALQHLVRSLPAPDPHAPVRLWVDRAFTMQGAGTVVTGTLAAGAVAVGDRLEVAGREAEVVVRGLQSRGQRLDAVTGTARVALNLRGVDREDVPRGTALVTPDAWLAVTEVDVLTDGPSHVDVVTHLGSAAVPTRARPLNAQASRLRFAHALPLHYGDRLLLREPSSRAIVGATVADLAPVPLRGRGAAAAVGAGLTVPAKAVDEVRRRAAVSAGWLGAAGLLDEPDALRVGDRWIDPERWQRWAQELAHLLAANGRDAALPLELARDRLSMPDSGLLMSLVAAEPGLEVVGGVIRRRDRPAADLSPVAGLLERLDIDPLAAPSADEVRSLGRGPLRDAVDAGRLRHLGGGIYVGVDAVNRALERLGTLEQPFPVSAVSRALGASRRVVVPLLEHLDAARLTRRNPDGTRVLVGDRR